MRRFTPVLLGTCGALAMALGMPGQPASAKPPGLVSWWKASGNANDSVGSNNGTIVGGVSFAKGHPTGKAFDFDGSTGYVKIGNPTSLQRNGGGFTIAAWVKFTSLLGPSGSSTGPCFTSTGCDMSIVDKMSQTGGPNVDGWRLLKQSDNRFWFCFGAAGNGCVAGSTTTVLSTTVVEAKKWYFVTGVFNPTSGSSIYVDGAAQASASSAGMLDSDAAPMHFGRANKSSAFMYGRIDDIQYYDRALTAAQILQLYGAG